MEKLFPPFTFKSTYSFTEFILSNIMQYSCWYRDANLHFVESPALAPPEVQIDLAAQQQ